MSAGLDGAALATPILNTLCSLVVFHCGQKGGHR